MKKAVKMCNFILRLNFFFSQKEELFEVELKERRGYEIKKMVPDGACLFRAVGRKIFFLIPFPNVSTVL